MLICHALGINKFSLLAHSAGAIYALATALPIPQHIRGEAARPATSADDGASPPLQQPPPPARRGEPEPGRESLMYMDRQNIPSAGSATSLARASSSANMRVVAAAGPLLQPPPDSLATA